MNLFAKFFLLLALSACASTKQISLPKSQATSICLQPGRQDAEQLKNDTKLALAILSLNYQVQREDRCSQDAENFFVRFESLRTGSQNNRFRRATIYCRSEPQKKCVAGNLNRIIIEKNSIHFSPYVLWRSLAEDRGNPHLHTKERQQLISEISGKRSRGDLAFRAYQNLFHKSSLNSIRRTVYIPELTYFPELLAALATVSGKAPNYSLADLNWTQALPLFWPAAPR